MASQWHYSKGGSRLGPVSSQRLKELATSCELAATDMVWKEGLSEWRLASTLKGLFPETLARPVGPPPLPTAKPAEPFQVPPLTAVSNGPSPRKPDLFDKARELSQRASAAMSSQGQG